MTQHSPREFTFSNTRWLRLGGFSLLYSAQGAPEGLLYVAVPSWLAARGVAAEAIAGYIAIILIPWSLKLVNGLLMDRITFLSMGRRRPWLIGAQLVLAGSLLVFGAHAPEGQDLAYVTAVGFLVNMAGAFQDVAIDGMAVDLVPENERARANGFMWGGKTLGIAAASFVTGHVITNFGYGPAAIVVAVYVGLVMLVPVLVRERPGERLMPWSQGEASAEAKARQLHRWLPIARSLFAAVLRPSSLLFIAAVFAALIGYGLHTALAPVFAVQELKFDEGAYGNLAGTTNLLGGLFGIALSGWIADWVGPRRALIASLLALAGLQGAVGLIPGLLVTPGVFLAYMITHGLLFVLMSVCLYAEAMAISLPRVAATQFSIYMAVLNLGTSYGAQQFKFIKPEFGYEGGLAVAAGVSIAAALLFGLAGFLRARAPQKIEYPPSTTNESPE